MKEHSTSDQPADATPQAPRNMTAQERVLAALRGQAVDRIPFVPLIGGYTVMELPAEITGREHIFGYDIESIIQASRALECELMVRHVPAAKMPDTFAPHLQLLGAYDSSVELKTEFLGNRLVETLTTPVGSLSGTWGFTNLAGWIPHPVDHLVNDYEEMKVFHDAVDRLSTESPAADDETFLEVAEAIGDDGVATATLPNTPLMYLIETIWGIESTYYLLHDHREQVEDILDKLHASIMRMAEQLAASPAQVVIQYENTSSTLLSPAVFRRYCLPYLNAYADILTQAGKIYLIHMCGTLRRLVDVIGEGRFDGIADISPAPTGDLPLDEAAARLPGKVVVGGIDATTFINPDADFVEMQVGDLIQRIKPFRGVLLGSADVTPRGARVENFRLIRRLVDTLGVYD